MTERIRYSNEAQTFLTQRPLIRLVPSRDPPRQTLGLGLTP